VVEVASGLQPLELLYEPAGLPAFGLPAEIAAIYPGTLGFEPPSLFANFIATVDGVAALRSLPRSSRVVGGGTHADRFVMALLRACAGALLMGANTLTHSSEAIWSAESLYPAAGLGYAKTRAALGLAPVPQLAVVTGSGSLDPSHPALEAGALVMTTAAGAARMRNHLPAAATIIELGDTEVDLRRAVAELHERGHGLVLSEGGPTLLGSLLDRELVDELFLTVSPLLAGRDDPAARLALVEGVELLPDRPLHGTLLGVRRDGDYLLLRYALANGAAA
jgi:riboflavin biosynthesis pyrimidine reductase